MKFKGFLSQPVRCLRPTSHPGLPGTRTWNGDTSSTAVRMWHSARLLLLLLFVIIWSLSPPQMVRVGLCISTGSCHGLGHAALTSRHVTHVSQCRQLYLDQRLVAVTQTGEIKVKIWMEDSPSNFSITLGWDVQFSFMLLLSYNEFDPLTFSQY